MVLVCEVYSFFAERKKKQRARKFWNKSEMYFKVKRIFLKLDKTTIKLLNNNQIIIIMGLV